MKKIILFLSLVFITSVFSYGQNLNGEVQPTVQYPMIDFDEYGNKIVIFTIEQARVIDNKLDILEAMEGMGFIFNDYDSICLKVINEKDKIIATQDLKIGKMENLLSNKDDEIVNLKSQIEKHLEDNHKCDGQLKIAGEMISTHKEEIRKLKREKLIGSIGGGATILGLIFLLIVK